jgi:amino acid adenylation domain-containing protein
MLVHDFLRRNAEQYPEKVALRAEEASLTYAEFEARSNSIARGLISLGVCRGDRVVIRVENGIPAAICIYAVLKAGAVFVVINPDTPPDTLSYIVEDAGAVGLITGRRPLQGALSQRFGSTGRGRKPFVVAVGDPASANGDGEQIPLRSLEEPFLPEPLDLRIIDQDLACLIYTSGSTGKPKGVVSGHDNVLFAAQSIISYLENTPDDIILNLLPLSFDYGLYQLLMSVTFGGTLVFESSFAYPAAVLRSIQRERITGLPGVPTLFSLILSLDLSTFDISSIRYVTNTAAAMPVEMVKRLCDAFPQARIYSMYGMTECKRTLYLPPERVRDKPASVGIPIPGTEAWVQREDGTHAEAGEVGELVVRGSHVMRGYWEAPEATAERFRSGPTPGERALYTGDLFSRDEEGFFYFVSRRDGVLKSQGQKVAPVEVERVLHELPEVAEAAVVGVKDEVLGTAIKAYVVPISPNLSTRAVLRHCSQRLERHKVPKYVVLTDSLPRTPNGKVDKPRLARGDEAEARPKPAAHTQ